MIFLYKVQRVRILPVMGQSNLSSINPKKRLTLLNTAENVIRKYRKLLLITLLM